MSSTDLRISFVIPVYNRPQEVQELLESMLRQETEFPFEVIIVEDGSSVTCENECKQYEDQLNLKYYFKTNSGPGQSRNFGFEKAGGNYCIFLDSDCVLPPHYVAVVSKELKSNYVDAFGGPDRAHASFTDLQKAINYSMTSFFTTGGIRGSSEKLEKFHPRSFNMGYSRAVFEKTGGFSKLRFGEDIDMSIRIFENGFKTGLIKNAFVYHKRRTSLKQFFKQIYNSGIARINLYKRHPQSLKLVHFAPAVFTLGLIGLVVLYLGFGGRWLLPILLHILLILIDSTARNLSLKIGLLSVVTSYIQLGSYGIGFLIAFWKRIVLNKTEFAAFENTFYD